MPFCVPGDGQPGHVYRKKTVNIAVLAYTPPQVSSLTGWRVDSAGSSRAAGTLGKCRAVWSYTSLGGANTCAVKAFIKPAGGSRNGPERGHGQRRGLLGGHRGGQHDPDGDDPVRAAPGADRQVWHGIGDGQPALGGLCHASERGGKQHCLWKGLRKKQRGGDCRRADAVPGDSTLRDWIRNTFFSGGAIYQSYAATSPASLFGERGHRYRTAFWWAWAAATRLVQLVEKLLIN